MTQCQEVLECIDTQGFITTMDAYDRGITRLSARIHELRRMGIDIKADTVQAKNRHGKPIHYAKYSRAV